MIEVGMKYLVTHRVVSHPGWNDTWVSGMDKYVGRVGVVAGLVSQGAYVKFVGSEDSHTYNFPESALQRFYGAFTPALERNIEGMVSSISGADSVLRHNGLLQTC